MSHEIIIVYNEPLPSGYDTAGEGKAVIGVLDAVTAVHSALESRGHNVRVVSLSPPFEQAVSSLNLKDDDMVFNLFEGFCGQPQSEALLPAYLAERSIKFTGCTARAIRLGLDKAAVKRRLHLAAIPTPGYRVVNTSGIDAFPLAFPCIVKPCAEDASHGITAESVVWNRAALEHQVYKVCMTYHGDALVEEFLDGREFNATVIGRGNNIRILPVSEIEYSFPPDMPRLLTYSAKWEPDSIEYTGSKAVCPASIPDGLANTIASTALRAFREIIGAGYARVDMRMDRSGCINVIEVNPNPDISPDAGAARQAAAAGWSYPEFIENLVNLVWEIN